jgi:hypothetical protein
MGGTTTTPTSSVNDPVTGTDNLIGGVEFCSSIGKDAGRCSVCTFDTALSELIMREVWRAFRAEQGLAQPAGE